MAFNLKKVLGALLYSSSQPLSIKDIQDTFARYHDAAASLPLEEAGTGAVEGGSPEPVTSEAPLPAQEPAEVLAEPSADPELHQDVPALVTTVQIRDTMDELASDMRAADNGLLLIEGAGGYRLVTHPRFARWVRILRSEPPPLKLSPSSLETLAVVAYRQPVTRAEIEAVRGVSAEAGITRLLERELIQITGRADQPGRPLQYGTTDQFLEFTGVKSVDDLPASDVLSNRQIDDWLQKAMNPMKPGDAEMGLPEEQATFEPMEANANGASPGDGSHPGAGQQAPHTP